VSDHSGSVERVVVSGERACPLASGTLLRHSACIPALANPDPL